jgi:hypothetical protein
MLADRSRLIRLVLIAATATAAVAWPTHVKSAYAGDDDDDGGDSADDGGDDSGGDKGAADDGSGDDDDEDADADQPPVTAGGLFTKATYPISAIDRPLTITKGIAEARLELGTDISAGGAFTAFNAGVSARYGLQDNSELQFGIHSDLNKFKAFSAFVGYEGSLSYDFIDFRATFELPITKTTDSTSGTSSTDVAPGVHIGFPFKYRLKPQFAIIALRDLMTINFKSKPDLSPQLGVIVQPIPAFAAILQTGITIKGFNTDAGNFLIPLQVALQYTPTNKIDFGLEFAFPNLKPAAGVDPDGPGPLPAPDAPKFYDNRTLLFFGTFRF